MKAPATLIIISLLIAVCIFKLLQLEDCIYEKAWISQDSSGYIEAADLLYNERAVHPVRPLGYAFILGLPNLVIDGPSVEQYIIWSFVINMLSWLATILLLFKTLNLFLSKRTSFWVSLVFTTCLGSMVHSAMVLTESMTGFLLMLACYYLFVYQKSKHVSHLLLAAAVLNVSILFRPGMYYFALLFTLGLVLYIAFSQKFKLLLHAAFLVSIILVAVQLISMKQSFGDFTPSYIDKVTWYRYLGAQANATLNNRDHREERMERDSILQEKNWSERSLLAKEDMKKQLFTNADNVTKEYLGNIIGNSYGGSHGIKRARIIHAEPTYTRINKSLELISKIQQGAAFLIFLAASLFIVIFRKRKNLALLLSCGLILYIIATSGISFWQGDRFYIVFYPLLIVIVGYLFKKRSP